VIRFFVRPDQMTSGVVTLEADDVYHLRTVLKAQPGQEIAVLDGSGREWPATVTEIGKTRATAQLRSPILPPTEPQTLITIAQALPRVTEKMEQVLQRGTEVGATDFWAYESARSLTHLTGERHDKRRGRWAAIVKTAAEQAHRARLPPRGRGRCVRSWHWQPRPARFWSSSAPKAALRPQSCRSRAPPGYRPFRSAPASYGPRRRPWSWPRRPFSLWKMPPSKTYVR